MKFLPHSIFIRPASWMLVFVILTFSLNEVAAQGKPYKKPANPANPNTGAEAVWNEVQASAQPPRPPAAWQTQQPSEGEIEEFKKSSSKHALAAADKAKDFYTRFPKEVNSVSARKLEVDMLNKAFGLGHTNAGPRLETAIQNLLVHPMLAEADRFTLRASEVERKAMLREPDGMDAVYAEFEKGVRALQRDFPKRTEIFQMLLALASNSEGERALKISRELVESSAEEEIKQGARELLKKFERLGKPLALQFAAVDGRPVDLQKLKGKVVLVDFWATWCSPCVKELPNVKVAYEKLNPKGFEIVGLSFDKDKETLEKFVAKNKMPWPQYFDGKGWENKWGEEFGIKAIPAMWLVDKKGNLRDLSARENLAQKVEKLLAED